MAYLDYASELTGILPKMPFPLAQKCINRAWRDVRESQLWSFLVQEDVLTAPAQVTAGTVALTRYSATATADATARATLDTLANPLITQRQFRVSQGPIYNVSGYDSATGILTLDRPYQEASNATAAYLLYRCYYLMPVADFLRFLSVMDPINGYRLKLNKQRQEIDAQDPTRGGMGNPACIVNYRTVSDPSSANYGWHMFELWPHPTSAIGYQMLYHRRGTDFVNATDALPPQIPEELLMQRALYRAYQWAEANKGRIPELRGSDYRFLMGQAAAEYKDLLRNTQRQDEEATNVYFIPPPSSWGPLVGPIDAKYAQSHDSGWWM